MSEYILPKRPANDNEFSTITPSDKDCLAYALVFGVPNDEAFAVFHVELTDKRGKLSKDGRVQCRNFFSYPKHREFTSALRDTIAKCLAHRQIDGDTFELNEETKEQAAKELLAQMIKMIKQNPNDPDLIKLAAELYKKYGMLEKGGDVIEPCRRYLPARCYSECAYRLFVESHIANKDIISECDYCRTRKFAEEKGWRFDPTKNLDLPPELAQSFAE